MGCGRGRLKVAVVFPLFDALPDLPEMPVVPPEETPKMKCKHTYLIVKKPLNKDYKTIKRNLIRLSCKIVGQVSISTIEACLISFSASPSFLRAQKFVRCELKAVVQFK